MQDQLRVVRQKCDEYFQQRNKLIDQQHQSMQDCVIEKERKDAKPAKSAETEPQARSSKSCYKRNDIDVASSSDESDREELLQKKQK